MQRILRFVLVTLLLSSLPGAILAQDDPNCAGAPLPQLTVGGFGQVAPGDPNNLRDMPSRSGSRVGSLPGGAGFSVLEGPVCADGFNWWRVDYGGQVGWTVEGSGGTYFLLPLEPVPPTATPGPVQDFVPPQPFDNRLAVGALARVISDTAASEPLRLRLHTEPGISTAIAGVVQEDELVTIEDGPRDADGLRWWRVRADDGRVGWMIEGQPNAQTDDLPYERTLLALCTTADSGRVAFIGRQALSPYRYNGYVYTANVDGSSPCIFDRLKLPNVFTTWGVFNFLPWELIMSPDGQQVAYIDLVNSEFRLYMMRQDGTRQPLTDRGSVYWVEWTPDGSRLLYTLGDIFKSNVWTQRPDGSALGALTIGDSSKSWAAWLPDNETVLYVDQSGAAVQMHGPTRTILWRVSVQSGGLRKLIDFTDDVRDILVSPDGQYVLITGFAQQIEPFVEITGAHTLVLDTATGEVVYEDGDAYYEAFWTRDSRSIVYPSASRPNTDSPEPVVLHYVPVLGGEPLTVKTGLTERFAMLRWFDDDNVLVYTDTTGALVVLNIRTGEVTAAADFQMP